MGAPARVCLEAGEAFAWPSPESVTVPPHASWKSQLELPDDAFFSLPDDGGSGASKWVKFIVLTSEPSQIYFQDAASEPFHYEFANEHIPIFPGMTRDEFAAVTLRNAGRQAIAGALLLPALEEPAPEYGVQLVSLDDLHPELVATILQTVAAHVTAPAGMSGFYLPLGVSSSCIESKRAEFAARGVAVGRVDRWLKGDACYAPGWGVGRLVALPAAELEAAYLDGRLTPDDLLLLTDTAPAELPGVAGLLTLEPSTPNAHAAILARSFGIPFAYARDADAIARAHALTGKHVVMTTQPARRYDVLDPPDDSCEVRLIDVDGLPRAQLAELRSLAAAPVLEVTTKRASGALELPVDGLVPADIDRVGGKAAHFGILRAATPEVTPSPALALTFDLWDAFLEQLLPGGTVTLRDEIARRLAAHAWPPDLRALDTTLEGVRDLIRDAPLAPALRTSVLEALASFDPMTRLRFRSSTNVEDSDTFTGAGLYDSATGCLADDLDEDAFGPSRCNPTELEEHGVLRAIQRVYASFYARRAYFERWRRGVDEADVGMGVLVHHSVPDELELANGVATLHVEGPFRNAELVSQTGAVSVTNPDGSALPEQVRVQRFLLNGIADDTVYTLATSSLLPLGTHVLEPEADYTRLMALFDRVADEYARATGKVAPFFLDFEYKKVAPGDLSLRQVRPLPAPDARLDVTPFFVGAPATLCVFGADSADVFAVHRSKSRIALAGGGVRLTREQLGTRLYDEVRVEYLAGTALETLEGDPAAFAGAEHAVAPDTDQATVLDSWSAGGARWTLRTRLPTLIARNETPVLTPDDVGFELALAWASPVPFLDGSPDTGELVPSLRTDDVAALWGHCPEEITITANFPRIEQTFTIAGGSEVTTSYWYPPTPGGPIAGYTAPAARWERTTISGLTTVPIVLTSHYSQTYAPNHHNAGGEYIFDPRLEPAIAEEARAELEAANVAYLVIVDRDTAGAEDEIWALGFEGTLRRW